MTQGFASLSPSPLRPSRPSPQKTAIDAEHVQQQWLSFFEQLDDPRGRQGCEHVFLSIVLIAVLAVIAGADGWDDIELYAISHRQWLATFLELPKGVPHSDTYRRVFSRITPSALQECFLGWVRHLAEQTGAQVIPIDGKKMRGSFDRSNQQSALHVVSA